MITTNKVTETFCILDEFCKNLDAELTKKQPRKNYIISVLLVRSNYFITTKVPPLHPSCRPSKCEEDV